MDVDVDAVVSGFATASNDMFLDAKIDMPAQVAVHVVTRIACMPLPLLANL